MNFRVISNFSRQPSDDSLHVTFIGLSRGDMAKSKWLQSHFAINFGLNYDNNQKPVIGQPTPRNTRAYLKQLNYIWSVKKKVKKKR